MEEYLKKGGWTTATNQVCPLGAPDYSSYLLNIANSGADVVGQHQLGQRRGPVHQAGQRLRDPEEDAAGGGVLGAVPRQGGRAGTDGGVFTATDWWWTLEDKYPLSKMFVDAFEQKYNYKPDWSAEAGYMQLACWARMVSEAGTFYPPDVIKTYEKGEHSIHWSATSGSGRRITNSCGR